MAFQRLLLNAIKIAGGRFTGMPYLYYVWEQVNGIN